MRTASYLFGGSAPFGQPAIEMVALRTYDDLPAPVADGLAVWLCDPVSGLEREAWMRYLASLDDETPLDRGFDRVCIDLGAGAGLERETHTGVLRWGSGLAALSVGAAFDTYVFHAGAPSNAAALQARLKDALPQGSLQFQIDLDDAGGLARARDLGRISVVAAPKVVISFGALDRLPFAIREIAPQQRRPRLLIRSASAANASWASLTALRYGQRAVDLVVGIPVWLRDRHLLETALLDEDAGRSLTRALGSEGWRALVQSDSRGSLRMLRTLYASRLGSQLGLHAADELVGPGKWALAKPIFASTHHRSIVRWRHATQGLATAQDELYLPPAS